MPHINEFKNRLKQIREIVSERLPDVAIVLAMSAKALAERRIKDKGFAVVYSQNKYPAWFLHGKELNQKGTKFLQDRGVNPTTGEQGEGKKKRRKKKGDPDPGNFETLTNWGEFRQAQGLQINFVDISYSNFMWSNMAPVSVKVTGEQVRAMLGATNKEAQNKMNWNFERYGDFVSKGLTEDDISKTLPEVVANEIVNILDNIKI